MVSSVVASALASARPNRSAAGLAGTPSALPSPCGSNPGSAAHASATASSASGSRASRQKRDAAGDSAITAIASAASAKAAIALARP